MNFPFTYSDKINFGKKNKNTKISKSDTEKELLNKYHFVLSDEEIKSFKANSPFLKIPFSLEYEINSDKINYKLHLDSLLKIILIVIIFTAFFLYASLNVYLWFALLFTVFFYALNIMIINGYIHSIFLKILKDNNVPINEIESLSEEQKTWMNDKNRCPACGHLLSDIDLICPECGLHMKRNRYTTPSDTSKYQNTSIKYHYRKK